jgi:hypothetical protein
MLSLSQAVLFVTTVIAIGFADAWKVVRIRDRSAAAVLLSLGASLVTAKLIGGFFASGPFPPAGGLMGTGLVLRSFSSIAAVVAQAQWDIASFGALFVLGIFGLLRAHQGKGFLAILAAVGLLTVNSLRYEYTWDIVKFGAVGFVALAIGAGVALADLARWADTCGRIAVCGVIVVALAGQGVLYPLFAGLLYESGARPPLSIQMIRPYFSIGYPVDQDDGLAVSFLRAHMKPWEVVYRRDEKLEPYAIWGGLPTQASVYPSDSEDNDAYGLGKQKFAARKALAEISESWFGRLAEEHVSWVVTDPKDATINAALDCSGEQGKAVLAARFGEVRVFHLQ